MNNVQENLDCMLTKLKDFLKTETIVGEPLAIGDVTIIPLITVGFGCGTGGGTGKDTKGNDGTGSGGGCGATISPTAVLVVKNNDVSLMPLKGKSSLSSLVEMVPEIVNKIKSNKNPEENLEEENQQEDNK